MRFGSRESLTGLPCMQTQNPTLIHLLISLDSFFFFVLLLMIQQYLERVRRLEKTGGGTASTFGVFRAPRYIHNKGPRRKLSPELRYMALCICYSHFSERMR